jgi:hypothetical protein
VPGIPVGIYGWHSFTSLFKIAEYQCMFIMPWQVKFVSGTYFPVRQSTRKGTIMNVKIYQRIGGLVLGAALCLQASAAMAGMVTTDNMAAQNQTAMEKAKVQSFLDRSDVKDRLQGLGVGGTMAKDRVAAMTDQEVHALAQNIDSMPAGAAGGGLSSYDLTLILLLVLLILLV